MLHLVKQLQPPSSSSPEDFPQVPPATQDLHPTSDIRFVMREMATLEERVSNLNTTVVQIEDRLQKAVERMSGDLKERISDLKEAGKASTADLKDANTKAAAEVKESLKELETGQKAKFDKIDNELIEFGKKVAFVKGGVWVLGTLFTIVAILLTALARKWIG